MDGNLIALARYEAAVDAQGAFDELTEEAAHLMLEAADDVDNEWHGGDAEEIALLRQHANEILAGEEDAPDHWLAMADGRDPNDNRTSEHD